MRSLVTSLLLLFLVGSLRAQDPATDNFEYDDIPTDVGSLPYIGVGGGYQLMVSFMNFDALNEISSGLGVGTFSGPLLMHGGGGFTIVGLIQNVRLGIYGAGGSKALTARGTVGGENVKRTFRFTSGLTAAHIDYVISPFSGARRLLIVPGVMLGASANTLKFAQSSDTAHLQDDILTGYPSFGSATGASGNNRQNQISRSYFFYYPVLNIEYAFTQFVTLRVGGGYAGSFALDDWTDTEEGVVSNVPDINANGPMVNVGLFLGLFQN